MLMIVTACAAQNGGGLFQRGAEIEKESNTEIYGRGGIPGLPGHGQEGGQPAPIGGVAFPLAFAAGYLMIKGRGGKQED